MSQSCENGSLFRAVSDEELTTLLEESLIIRYMLVFAVSNGPDSPEEMLYLESFLSNRLKLAQLGRSNAYLLVCDVGAAFDLTLRYILDALSQIVP